MIFRVPYQLRTGQTLSPGRLTEMIRSLQFQVTEAQRYRFHYSTFTLDWSYSPGAGLAGTSVTRPSYLFNPPFAVELLGMAVSATVTGASGTTVTLTVSLQDFSLQLSGTVPVSGTLALTGTLDTPKLVAANALVTATASWTSSASVDIAALTTVVNVRTDRQAYGAYTAWNLVESALPRAGAVSSNTALNAEIARGATAIASMAGGGAPAIQIVPAPAPDTGTGFTMPLPATGRTLRGLQVGATTVTSSAANWQAVLTMPGSANTTAVVSANMSGAVSTLTAVTHLETSNNWLDSSKDDTLALTRSSGSGTAALVYAVLYWS